MQGYETRQALRSLVAVLLVVSILPALWFGGNWVHDNFSYARQYSFLDKRAPSSPAGLPVGPAGVPLRPTQTADAKGALLPTVTVGSVVSSTVMAAPVASATVSGGFGPAPGIVQRVHDRETEVAKKK